LLFPSTKKEAGLRIFRKDETQQNESKGRRKGSEIAISKEYQEHLFRLSPTLKQCFDDYQHFNQNDFWAHVVCAANEEQRLRQDRLGFAAKDEHKEAKNLIKDLYQQIAYKFSPLQNVLARALGVKTRHKDLLSAHAEYSSY
jgi:hypothetical protein